jgi:hypothetical protein
MIFQFGALVFLDQTWESTHAIQATPRSKEFPALLRIVLESGQKDMTESLSPQNRRNPQLAKAAEKATRRALVIDLVDILAGGQLSSWVDRSLLFLEQASDQYPEDDPTLTDSDALSSISLQLNPTKSLVILFPLVPFPRVHIIPTSKRATNKRPLNDPQLDDNQDRNQSDASKKKVRRLSSFSDSYKYNVTNQNPRKKRTRPNTRAKTACPSISRIESVSTCYLPSLAQR